MPDATMAAQLAELVADHTWGQCERDCPYCHPRHQKILDEETRISTGDAREMLTDCAQALMLYEGHPHVRDLARHVGVLLARVRVLEALAGRR